MADFEPFHSAVNRIPLPRESVLKLAETGVLPPDIFSDGAPIGHDHLRPDLWSGFLDVEMTVRTPLVFGEQTQDEHGLPSVQVPLDEDGRAIVPGTMIKGMISRAYELFTASRFRMFGDHEETLTYRADPAAALHLLPGRICEHDGALGVELLDGLGKATGLTSALIKDDLSDTGEVSVKRDGHPGIPLNPGSVQPTGQQVLARFRDLTHHSGEVEVQLSRWRGEKGPERLMVTGVWVDDHLEEFFRVSPHINRTTMNVWGYPCRTSPERSHASDLFPQKKYERFFFKSDYEGASRDGVVLPLTRDHGERYAAIIRSYLDHHDLPGGDKHLLNRAASEASELTPGTLVFVDLDCDTPEEDCRVLDVYPTMVGRRSYEMSPHQLAQDQKVLPLSKAGEASPADRLFGYVIGGPPNGAMKGDVSSRGRLFFSAVDTSSAEVRTEPHTLAPLLAPKLSSARRFLTDAKGGSLTEASTDGDKKDNPPPRSKYYSSGQLLGAAAYPVHRSLIDSGCFPTVAANAGALDQSNEKVRVTARSWIAPGSIMRCRIRFENLAHNELAVLVWILSPENLVPMSERFDGAAGYLRMGIGKPYGLGALEVRLTKDGLHAIRANGDPGLARAYRELSGCLGTIETVCPSSDFILGKESTLQKTPWVQALQRAAFGYADGIPVRYMSLEENKMNNKTDSQTGLPKAGCGIAPRALWGRDSAKSIEIPRRS